MEKRHLVYGALIVVAAMVVYWMLRNESAETGEENNPEPSDAQVTEAGSNYTANVPYRTLTSAPSPDQSSLSVGQFLTYPNFNPTEETSNLAQIGLPDSAYIN